MQHSLEYSGTNTCLGFCGPIEILQTRVLETSRLSYSLAWILEPPLKLLCCHQHNWCQLKWRIIGRRSSCPCLQHRSWQQKQYKKCRSNTRPSTIASRPHEETGKQHKLSRPWHGPYQVVSHKSPDVTVVKIYFPQQTQSQIHQTKVIPCPDDFPAGYYWYGWKQHSPGWSPWWLETLLDTVNEKEKRMIHPFHLD